MSRVLRTVDPPAARHEFGAIRLPNDLLTLAIFGFLTLEILRRVLVQRHLSDFRHFYLAAEAMRQYLDLYRSGSGGYVYPPLLAFLLLPLTYLSIDRAAAIWLLINATVLVIATRLAALAATERITGETLSHSDLIHPAHHRSSASLIMLPVTVISFGRIKAELQMLQTDVVVLGAYALGLWWIDRRPVWAAVVLGFAFNIKYYTLPVVAYFCLRRRWSAATSMIVSAIAFALLPALQLGWQTNLADLSIAFAGVLKSLGISRIRGQQFSRESCDGSSCHRFAERVDHQQHRTAVRWTSVPDRLNSRGNRSGHPGFARDRLPKSALAAVSLAEHVAAAK